jgi:succinoglycan biosynthesis transport protein ExoP
VVPKNKRAATSDLIAMTPGLGVDQAYQRPFMDVRELVASLWCERFWVVTATLAVLALVALYLLVTPKTYTATAQLLIDLNRPLTGEAQSLGADTTRFMMGPIIDSQVEIIRATRIVSRVIQKTGYAESVEAHELPEDAQAAPETSPSAGNAAAATGDAAAAGGPGTASPNIPLGIIGKFQENLDVRRKGLTLILLVQFSDKDPVRAATVANAIVDEYLVDRDRREQAASKRAVETLRGRIAQARADLAANEQALQELSEKYNLVSAGGSTLDEREVAETATQLNLARAEEAKLLADLQQWEAQSKDTTGIATIGKLTDARHNYEVARNQVALLEKTLASMKRDFAQKTTALNRFAELQKETQATRDSYLAMVTRIKQLEMEQNYSMLDIQMLDSAAVPQSPSSPNLTLMLGVGLLGGLGLGMTIALIKDHMSTVLRTPQLVQSNLGVPHIATLDQLRGRNTDAFALLNTHPNAPFVQGIVLIHRYLAEIRSSGQRVIAIVSVNDGDGKSTIAAALAQYAAAITHQKTALIDCDIHQRSLSKRFAPNATHSFAQALEGTLTNTGVLIDPPDCAFSICTSPWEENPLGNTQMLMSPAMSKFVRSIGKDFDLVILDTAGIRNNVETRAIVSMADIVILVVDARSTTVEEIAMIKETAPDLETKLAGVVLNHAG